MTYAQKLKDPRWQKRRLHILEQRGWKCERCRDDKTTLHVHHKKYRGQPWEALDNDLEVLCEPCHSGKHGKALNPLKTPVIYCGGKIGPNDWRHRLFNLSLGEGYESFFEYTEANIRAFYGGPYFQESQHGSAHGEKTHGQFSYDWLEEVNHVYAGEFEDLSLEWRMARRFEVHDKCLQWMDEADAYFFYIDGPGAYGTLVELFYAGQKFPKKRRSLFFSSEALLEEYWFVAAYGWRRRQQRLPKHAVQPDVVKAFQAFLADHD
jgi:hypothetical protein